MDNQHFLDEKHLKPQNERPTFLTVLCIITFVISGLLLISAISSSVTFSEESQIAKNEFEIEQTIELAEMFAGGEEVVGLDEQIEMMELRQKEEMENFTVLTLITFSSILLSLLGAFFMYRLKKIGFHLYIVSKIIALLPLLILTATSAVVWMLLIMFFFSAIFIFMYSRNLKYLS